MKQACKALIIVAAASVCAAAWGQSSSVLLEKGIYTEETTGDLDGAIKIYQKIIASDKATRPYVAQAYYRLGMCYLKRGQSKEAIAAFEKLVADFPEQGKLIGQARKHITEATHRRRRLETKKIVRQAVMTISTCTETDPRVRKSLASLEGLDENAVVKELATFLDYDADTIRRSAIYILWQGGFKGVKPAVPHLQKLCSHEEDTTRGMAALALGGHKAVSAFDNLCNMTLKDPSGYARRCAAYALGLMGRAEAKPVLDKALKDSDRLVRNNAEAALRMLSMKDAKGKPALDEPALAKQRDQLAAKGDVVAACEAEMQRVLLRKRKGRAYKDKIDLAKIYEVFCRQTHPAKEQKEAALKAVLNYLPQHKGKDEYEWRIYHLLSAMSEDLGDAQQAAKYLDSALEAYPEVRYSQPSKYSKFHHLVNQRAAQIWRAEGVEKAQSFALNQLTENPKCEYLHVWWWQNMLKEKGETDRLAPLMKEVEKAYGDRIRRFPERRQLYERYRSEVKRHLSRLK